MSIPEQSGDSFDFCVLFRVYFIGKGAVQNKIGVSAPFVVYIAPSPQEAHKRAV